MMFTNSAFGRNLAILEKTLQANSQRRDIIANNLANADTPNFKRSELNFEAEMKRALDFEQNKPLYLQANTNHDRHIAFATPVTWDRVTPTRHLDYLSEVNQNGNNVDLDREVAERAKADKMYDLLTSATKFQFNQISLATR